MKIIRERERIEATKYALLYEYTDSPGAGYSFPCDESGNVFTENQQEQSRLNYAACLAGQINGRKIVCKGIETQTCVYTNPAVGQCSCGAHVELDGFTNTCDVCKRDYNWAGQLLAPRSQWGEETGEHPADIARIP